MDKIKFIFKQFKPVNHMDFDILMPFELPITVLKFFGL